MKYTINQFRREFPNDDACLDRIMQMRYGKTTVCPKCEKESKFHRVTGRRQYACQWCSYQIAPCAGTVFEKSRTSLSDWFYAMYLFTSSRHGVPAKELERQLGVTYKTAWRMAHQLRKLMQQADNGGSGGQLSGHVEIDETFVGGRTNIEKRFTDKTRVFGMMERGGNVRTGSIVNIKRATIEPIIKRHVKPGSTISTDELRSYHHLAYTGYIHGIVRHNEKKYVIGIHHTNSIEGFWSRLKNSIRGTHIHVSQKHMNKYASEFAFRFNHKEQPGLMFNHLLAGLLQPRLAND